MPLTVIAPNAALISATPGHPFRTPFASAPGTGLSSSTVNLLWGFANLLLAYLLLCHVGRFELRDPRDAAALGLGILLLGLFSARHFGSLHGGNLPR